MIIKTIIQLSPNLVAAPRQTGICIADRFIIPRISSFIKGRRTRASNAAAYIRLGEHIRQARHCRQNAILYTVLCCSICHQAREVELAVSAVIGVDRQL